MTDYDELRRLAAAATPGPWTAEPYTTHGPTRNKNVTTIRAITRGRRVPLAYSQAPGIANTSTQLSDTERESNARFIAASRTAIPELLDELADAHSIIADLRRQLAGLGIPTGETK